MFYKIIFFTLFVFEFSYASFQEVSIGKIDNYYTNKITHEELKAVIDEIEYTFESQLGFNVFDYSYSGKPIDIVYIPPVKLEKEILKIKAILKRKQTKISKLKNNFPSKQITIENYKRRLNEFTYMINTKTHKLNSYIKDKNSKKTLSNIEYQKVQTYVKREKRIINNDIKNLKNDQKKLQSILSKYNNKIFSYNNLIREYNQLNNEIIRKSRRFKKVKGKTFGLKEISLKTYYQDGKKINEKSEKNSMSKIEIYGFENISQLKVVLAHEIAHLVGIPHINIKNALMNPILQKKQETEFMLIYEDIINFQNNF